MIPTPAALVCPKTYDTVAEDTCNIDSHISIDRTHDKPGILRQARYIQAVLSRLSRELLESFPILAGLHTFWFVSLPDTWDRFNRTHSQQPGGEHTRPLTTLNRVCWGWACCRANHFVSSRAVLKSCLMSYSALVILSAWFRALLWGNRWNKSKALLGAAALQAFKALSLRPTFQPTSTPEQASRRLVKMQRRLLNKRPAIRTEMWKIQSPADLFNWCQALFACNIVSHLSIDRTHNQPGILRQARYTQAVLKQTCQRITQVGQVWSEKSFLSLVQEFLDAINRHSHPLVAPVYGKGLSETLYKQVLWNIHESSWLLIPIPAALVSPKTCNTMAEDTCNIASHLSHWPYWR